ncbi:MAG: PP2C family protein-serine/threonine phosphatase [Planctomycetota bacterium]
MSHEPVRTIFRGEMTEPLVMPVATGTAAVFSARSPLKETPNEDAVGLLAIDDDRAVVVIADGLGGHAAGDAASRTAVEALVEAIAAGDGGNGSLRGAILDGFERANEAVIGLGLGAGSTMAAVEIQGDTIRPYHAGDSAILVVGQRGRLRLQTIPHSPIGYALESGLLDEHEAIHHHERHLVSNMVGSPEMRIEIGSALALQPRDTLVLGSDGLFDNLRIGEIVEHVRTGALDVAAGDLLAACRRRMCEPDPAHPSKPDDLTFVVYRPRG